MKFPNQTAHRARCLVATIAFASNFLLPAANGGSATPAAPLILGETFTIDSKSLSETRRVNVYLPPTYSKPNSSVRLPVLYMPDGGMAEDFIHVAGLIQVLTGDGIMRPFILVGIENTERRRDLTGPTENPEDKKIAPHIGGSAAFRKFLRAELMPEIKARYRTTHETAIVGESLAGLFIVETLLLEPDLFDTYIAFDPSLWWNNAALLKVATTRFRSWPPEEKTLYFASSDEPGIIKDAEKLNEILRRDAPASLHWSYKKLPSEKHSTIYHPAALQAFRELFKPKEKP